MTPLLNSIAIALLGAGLTFAAASFWFKKNQAVKEAERLATEHDKLDQRVRDLEKQLSQVGAAIVPINAAFQAILIKELTHFHTPEMDELLAKLDSTTVLTDVEAERLGVLLLEREKTLDSNIPESERDAAHILPAVMKRVRAEAAIVAPIELKVVSIAAEPDKVPTEESHD